MIVDIFRSMNELGTFITIVSILLGVVQLYFMFRAEKPRWKKSLIQETLGQRMKKIFRYYIGSLISFIAFAMLFSQFREGINSLAFQIITAFMLIYHVLMLLILDMITGYIKPGRKVSLKIKNNIVEKGLLKNRKIVMLLQIITVSSLFASSIVIVFTDDKIDVDDSSLTFYVIFVFIFYILYLNINWGVFRRYFKQNSEVHVFYDKGKRLISGTDIFEESEVYIITDSYEEKGITNSYSVRLKKKIVNDIIIKVER